MFVGWESAANAQSVSGSSSGSLSATGSTGPQSDTVDAGPIPPNLPSGCDVRRARFENWDGSIVVDEIWTAFPTSPDQLLELANWAVANGYRLRLQGHRHNWSPMLVRANTPGSARVLLVDTITHLNAIAIEPGGRARAQAGASMQDLLDRLAEADLSFTAVPAPGDLSVGGILAVGAHGTAVPATGEGPLPGKTFGCMSNSVVEATILAWNEGAGSFELRTLQRNDPQIAGVLTNFGRACVVEVVFQARAQHFLHCRNYTDIHYKELFAPPSTAGARSLASIVDQSGRVEVIWYSYTDRPWVQVWNEVTAAPAGARKTTQAFNYPFADQLPDWVAGMVMDISRGAGRLMPTLNRGIGQIIESGLTMSNVRSFWGEARFIQHFVRPTTLRVSAQSYALLTSRTEVQAIVSEFAQLYWDKAQQFTNRGRSPLTNCMEIRVTGTDDPSFLGIDGAVPPAMSATSPFPGKPEWDTVVWLDVLVLPGSTASYAFCKELETDFFDVFPAERGILRPEWSKRWAHTADKGPWTDPTWIKERIPRNLPAWNAGWESLEALDPRGVFTTEFHAQMRGK